MIISSTSLMGILIIFRLIITIWTPIVADESYYLLWSQQLDWSYVDHPGMIAWLSSLFIAVIKEPLIAIRLLSLTLYSITCFALYHSARLLLPAKQSRIMVLFFMMIPYNFIIGITMQVEQCLIAFCAIALFYFTKCIITNQHKYLIPVAIALGMATLSKYTAIVLAGGMVISLIIKKRHLLLSQSCLIGLGCYLICLLPIIIWNFHNDFISFSFHGDRINAFKGIHSFIEFAINQLLYLSPVLIYSVVACIRKKQSNDITNIFLILTTASYLPFVMVSFQTTVYGHWTAIACLPAVLAIGVHLTDHMAKQTNKLIIFTGFITIITLLTTPITNPLNVFKNYQYGANLQSNVSHYDAIFSDNHGTNWHTILLPKPTHLFSKKPPRSTHTLDGGQNNLQSGTNP